MFDRLSSLVIALTLIAIAAILAALAGGDSLTIAILAAAGLAATAIVHAAAPAPLTKARAETAASPPAPPPSLLPHPDFVRRADQEPDPLPGPTDTLVTAATDPAIRVHDRHPRAAHTHHHTP